MLHMNSLLDIRWSHLFPLFLKDLDDDSQEMFFGDDGLGTTGLLTPTSVGTRDTLVCLSVV